MKKIGIGILVVLGIGLLYWVNTALFKGDIMGLPDEVIGALESDSEVQITFHEDDSWMALSPAQSTPTMGLILYPEGRMDIRSYVFIGRAISEEGYLVVFLSRRTERDYDMSEELPRIEDIMGNFPEISTWVVGGHTFGGDIAADYAAANPDKVAGVVLWATRMGSGASLTDSGLPVLLVYGTEDEENADFLANTKTSLPADTVYVAIEGGNRTGYANYGPMAADVGATISSDEQQAQAAAATLDFLASLSE